MNMKRYILKPFLLLLTFAAGLITSCSQEEPNGGSTETGEGTLKISVAALSHETTRGMEDFTIQGNEKIHSCKVAIVKSTGLVIDVLDLPASSSGTDKETYNVTLNSGTYNLYALANMGDDCFSSLGVTKGVTVNQTNLKATLHNLASLSSSTNIPMSGYLDGVVAESTGAIKVGGSPASEVKIDLVRLAGKVEFCFTNNSPEKMIVEKIDFQPVASASIKLFDYPTASAPTMPEGTTYSKLTSSPNLSIDPTKGDSFSFYLREVTSNHPTESFPISIYYRRGSATAELQEMTALLYDFKFINRNDWLKIPITLTDRKLVLDVDFYPPIGGYPPVSWVDKDDEYYVTFATGGWFSITPTVVNKTDGSIVPNKDVTMTIPATGGISNTSFFRIQPTVSSSGEITGEIATGLAKDAKSVVTVEVTVTDKDASGNFITKETFKRKIHFICK